MLINNGCPLWELAKFTLLAIIHPSYDFWKIPKSHWRSTMIINHIVTCICMLHNCIHLIHFGVWNVWRWDYVLQSEVCPDFSEPDIVAMSHDIVLKDYTSISALHWWLLLEHPDDIVCFSIWGLEDSRHILLLGPMTWQLFFTWKIKFNIILICLICWAWCACRDL